MTNDNHPDWKSSADEAKRQVILDAALRVFGTRGFDEPSMDDIAAEADYTRRSLYRFFFSKEELGIALALRSCHVLTDSLGSAAATSLFAVAWAYHQFSLSHPQEFRVVLETRQLMMTDRVLPLRGEWASADDFASVLASRNEREREAMAAAAGYVEFRFRHRAVWQDSGLGGSEDTVKAILKRILNEESA